MAIDVGTEAYPATINPGWADRALRSAQRIGRIDESMVKAKERGDTERVASLLTERNRRAGQLKALRDALNGVDL